MYRGIWQLGPFDRGGQRRRGTGRGTGANTGPTGVDAGRSRPQRERRAPRQRNRGTGGKGRDKPALTPARSAKASRKQQEWEGGRRHQGSQAMLAQGSPAALAAAAVHLASAGPCCACAGYRVADRGVAMATSMATSMARAAMVMMGGGGLILTTRLGGVRRRCTIRARCISAGGNCVTTYIHLACETI